MENVYDILVNFKKKPYEFYEWEKTDCINHIKKIPSFKVNDKTILDFIKNDIIVNKNFLDKISLKTEVFISKQVKRIKYSCILYNDKIVIAFMFDNDGLNIGKSKLLFDESDEILKNGIKTPVTNIEYKIINKNNFNNLLTRKEYYDLYLIIKYLDRIYKEKKEDELNYLFYECYNKESNNYITSYKVMKNNLILANSYVINKIKSLIKITKS